MPAGAGALSVGTLRSSRGGADAGGADCSIGAGLVGGAAICGGTASAGCVAAGPGGADDASARRPRPPQEEHGSHQDDASCRHPLEQVRGFPRSWTRGNRLWPARIVPRRGRRRFGTLRCGDGGCLDWQAACAAKVFEVLSACHGHRMVERKRCGRYGSRPAINVSASLELPVLSATMARLFRVLARSGCCGPSSFS